ncbi:MAG TPA: aminoglycoside phosphotransferase family protein [Anaerolineales bacterium]|nr:aminoglycoside phosphotransferase family protein [Anaerolineales bacterium]
MKLPPEFITTIQNVYREDGHAFLNALPDLIAEASKRWNLTDVQPVPTLSYNFVAFAKRAQGDVVLKMGVPNREMESEIAALQLFNGEGACKMLEYDEEKCWMILERLNPGEMLVTLEDDEEATHIAAEVMKKIWRPMESSGLPLQKQDTALQKFILLSDWFDGLKRLRAAYNGGTGPLNEDLVERVEVSVNDFFLENHHPVLMHGDFHHYNILSSERGWLIIDPKGVIGPAGYEAGPLLINPWGELINKSDIQKITKRRIDILHEHLGFERERIREWGLAHAVLSAWWGIEDHTGWEYAAAFAEMIAGLEM